MARAHTEILQCEKPLRHTYARVRARNPYLQVHVGGYDGSGGWSMRDLLASGCQGLDQQLAIMFQHYKSTDLDVLVRFFFGGFAYALASATVGPFVVDRRVPAVSPETVGFACGEWGGPEAVILPDVRFYCLPDDPAAGHDDALLVADRHALRDLLREELIACCEPLIASLRQKARIGARAFWISVAETCASALVDALPRGTSEFVAHDEVQALIGQTGCSLRAKPEIIVLNDSGRSALGVLGSDCCCNCKLPGGSYCDSCPHRPREARIAALEAWVASQAEAPAALEAAPAF